MYVSYTGIDPRGYVANSFINSSGSRNLAVNGSVTPVTYTMGPFPGSTIIVRSLYIVGLSSGGSVGNELFVDIAALTNGLTVQFGKNADLFALHNRDITTPGLSLFPIRTNADFATLASTVLDVNGTDALKVVWDLVQAGIQIRLKSLEREYLQIVVRDNLSALGGLYVTAIGHQEVA